MKKNWFILVMAGAIIASLVIFYLGVISYYSRISEETNQLNGYKDRIEKIMTKKGEVPSQKWVAAYEARQKELDSEIAGCRNYYAGIDKTLEKWFPGLAIDKNDMPSVGDFKARYLSEKDVMIRQLKAKKLYGAADEETGEEKKSDEGKDLGFGEPSADNLRKLQKQFWIQKSLFTSIMESGVAKCERLEFPGTSPSRPVSFSYGTLIPFNLTVCIQNKDIPGFIYNMMKFRGDKDASALCILFRNVSVTRLPDEIRNISEAIEEKPQLEKNRETYKPEPARLPLSRLSIEGEALDFDFSVVAPVPKAEPPRKDKPPKDKPAKKPAKDKSDKDKGKEEEDN
ncbi:MAG: hypothetical protein AB1599_05880 [Planctomycetota bacterium]